MVALEGIRAIMEIHFRAVVVGKKHNCWFTTWDLSQVVQNFELILAAVFNKSSRTDVGCLEKVRVSQQTIYVYKLTVHFTCVDLLNHM